MSLQLKGIGNNIMRDDRDDGDNAIGHVSAIKLHIFTIRKG
jgi:hypothetical protein